MITVQGHLRSWPCPNLQIVTSHFCFRPEVSYVTRARAGWRNCAERPWCGVENEAFFTCWQSAPCQSTQLWISLHWRLADRPILGTNALPSLSPVSTFHIRYYTNAEPLLPAVSSNYPLTASFFFFLFYPHSTKCGSRLVTAGQKKSESASCLSFLSWHSDILSMQEEVTGREEGEEGREVVEAEGLYKHDEQIRDLSIKQAVTTRCLANWIVPGSPERAQTILSLALLNY